MERFQDTQKIAISSAMSPSLVTGARAPPPGDAPGRGRRRWGWAKRGLAGDRYLPVGCGVAAKNIVYFDLETQRSFGDVGGFSNKSKMGVSVGVSYSTARGSYEIYPENEMERLGEDLVRADLVAHRTPLYQVLELPEGPA